MAERTQRAPIRLALNAVGGDNALQVAKTLASDATMVTYGAMSLQPLKIPNGMLIFKNLRFTGFWVNKWYDAASPQQRAETFAPLFEMAKRGLLRTPVEKIYSLGEATAAVAHAMREKRGGKVVFDLDELAAGALLLRRRLPASAAASASVICLMRAESFGLQVATSGSSLKALCTMRRS